MTSYEVNASAAEASPPTVVIKNSFSEIKVVYTELDAAGSSLGNVETTWKVGKGAR